VRASRITRGGTTRAPNVYLINIVELKNSTEQTALIRRGQQSAGA